MALNAPPGSASEVHHSLPPSQQESEQARTQDFAQEGPPALEGASRSPGAPWATRGPRRSGISGYQGLLGGQGPRKPGALGRLQGPIGSPWGPSGNQGHMNGTFISIFISSKRFVQC